MSDRCIPWKSAFNSKLTRDSTTELFEKKKKIFREPQTSSDLDKVLRDFVTAIKTRGEDFVLDLAFRTQLVLPGEALSFLVRH